MGVGMPFCLYLLEFGEHVRNAFGHVAYHVGSSFGAENKSNWRDVDVRLMIPDDEYEQVGFGDPKGYPQNTHSNSRWVSTVLAWSCFGKNLTGLPIDFQIQPVNWANEYEKGPRSALISLERARALHAMFDLGMHEKDEMPLDVYENPIMTYKDPKIIYYGPFRCPNCGALITKMATEFGGTSFTYPVGPVYPNTRWHPHVCDPANVKLHNDISGRNPKPGPESLPPPESPR